MQEWCCWWGLRAWKIFHMYISCLNMEGPPYYIYLAQSRFWPVLKTRLSKVFRLVDFFVTFAPTPKILESMLKPGRYASSWPDFKPSTQHHWTCSKVLAIAIGKHMHLVWPYAGRFVKPLNGSHGATLIQFEWTGPLTFFPLTNRIAFSHNPPCLNWRKNHGYKKRKLMRTLEDFFSNWGVNQIRPKACWKTKLLFSNTYDKSWLGHWNQSSIHSIF